MNADQPAVAPVGPLESYCPRSLMPTLVGALTMLVLFTAQTWGFQVSNLFADTGFAGMILLTMCQPLLFLHVHVKLAFRNLEMHQRLKKADGIEWTDSVKYWDPRSLRCLLGARAWIKYWDPAVAASSSKAEISNPLEIFPPMMLNQSPLHESEGHQSSGAGDQTCGADYLCDEGKQALLELGFVPTYEQLRYVKSKSGVEIAIVAVQAAGYLLGILERMAADQRISPVEALATFLGILMILNALLQLFASPAYKRALLSHLYPPQFRDWQDRKKRIQERRSPDTWWHVASRRLLIYLTILLPLVSAIYFAVHFLVPHDHRCLICFIPALLFSLNLILLVPFLTAISINSDKTENYVAMPLLPVLVLLYVSSFVVAVIGTVLEWDHKFNEPTKSWYRWIIPHIGS